MEAFERFILRSDHPKALAYGLQLAEYCTKLSHGTETKADTESLRASLIALYEDPEIRSLVPEDVDAWIREQNQG